MPGYIGVNCSAPCPYPYYGVGCQKTCNCSRDVCDVPTGCISLTTSKYFKTRLSRTLKCHQKHILFDAIYYSPQHHSCFFIRESIFFFSCLCILLAQEGCIAGFFGKNCRGRCMYPYFGVDCQERCDCVENMCDVSTGCLADTTGQQ